MSIWYEANDAYKCEYICLHFILPAGMINSNQWDVFCNLANRLLLTNCKCFFKTLLNDLSASVTTYYWSLCVAEFWTRIRLMLKPKPSTVHFILTHFQWFWDLVNNSFLQDTFMRLVLTGRWEDKRQQNWDSQTSHCRIADHKSTSLACKLILFHHLFCFPSGIFGHTLIGFLNQVLVLSTLMYLEVETHFDKCIAAMGVLCSSPKKGTGMLDLNK